MLLYLSDLPEILVDQKITGSDKALGVLLAHLSFGLIQDGNAGVVDLIGDGEPEEHTSTIGIPKKNKQGAGPEKCDKVPFV